MVRSKRRDGMKTSVRVSPKLSPTQMQALLRQREREHQEAYFEAIRDGNKNWRDVVEEFLTGYDAPHYLCLQEPSFYQTIGHIAAEEKDETLWAELLNVGEEHKEAFAKMLNTRDRHERTVEQQIRSADCTELGAMLDEYLGIPPTTK